MIHGFCNSWYMTIDFSINLNNVRCSMRAISIITFLQSTFSSLAASSHRNLIRALKKKKKLKHIINSYQILEYDKIGDMILYKTTKNNYNICWDILKY